MDYQVQKATEHNAKILFAVGKRLPRWPECHIPDWAINLNKEEQEKEGSDNIHILKNIFDFKKL